jgi:hypothetical protein
VVDRPPDDELLDLDGDAPIVLAGTPDAVRGVLPLRNRGDRRAVVRDVALEDPRGALGLAMPGTHRLPTTVVRPQQARTVPISLALDPTTPAGEYPLALRVGGRERRAVVHVVESVVVDVSPNPLVIENRPDETIRKTVLVTNGGNVPVTIGEIGAVVLDDELLACRSLRATADALGDTDDDEGVTVARMLTQLARDFKTTFEHASRLRVRNVAGNVEIQPGQVAPLALEIEVPGTLEPRTRFFGRIAIYDVDLQLVVVPFRGTRKTPEPPQPRRRRSGTTSRSTDPASGASPRRAT